MSSDTAKYSLQGKIIQLKSSDECIPKAGKWHYQQQPPTYLSHSCPRKCNDSSFLPSPNVVNIRSHGVLDYCIHWIINLYEKALLILKFLIISVIFIYYIACSYSLPLPPFLIKITWNVCWINRLESSNPETHNQDLLGE